MNLEFHYLSDRPEALSKISKWYFDEWGDLSGDESREDTLQRIRDYLNRDEIPLSILAVDSEDGEIIGAGRLKNYEMKIYPDKKHWLGGIYVSAEHRGKEWPPLSSGS